MGEWPPRDVYFMDSPHGDFVITSRARLGHSPFDEYQPPPHADESQWGAAAPLRLTLGGAGSGIAFHMHAGTWNELFVGAKRWSLYAPNQMPAACGLACGSHRDSEWSIVGEP